MSAQCAVWSFRFDVFRSGVRGALLSHIGIVGDTFRENWDANLMSQQHICFQNSALNVSVIIIAGVPDG
jgi:hypothetical protein